jgi:hypothetical protein
MGGMADVRGTRRAPPGAGVESVLEAVLERVTYANEETGYTIARVATEHSGGDLLTVVGPLAGAQVGEPAAKGPVDLPSPVWPAVRGPVLFDRAACNHPGHPALPRLWAD